MVFGLPCCQCKLIHFSKSISAVRNICSGGGCLPVEGSNIWKIVTDALSISMTLKLLGEHASNVHKEGKHYVLCMYKNKKGKVQEMGDGRWREGKKDADWN